MSGTNGERVLLQVLVTMEVAQTIRVRAALSRVPPGRVIEAAILATNGTNGVLEPMGPMVKAAKPAKKPAELKPKAEKMTGPKVKKETSKPDQVGPVWDQEKLKRVMEGSGLTGRTLAEKLESKNGTPPNKLQINRWVRGAEKIPSRYWSQLERLFGGEA